MTLPPGFKFISGGQTGADRAALDVALKMNIACGGWCPEDRSAEDGAIELKYPLIPAPGAGYRDRTRLNVRDSDGTVIMGAIPLRGGSLGTLSECLALNKPHLVIDRSSTPVRKAAQLLREFVRDHRIMILNVSGPRASEEPGIYEYVRRILRAFLAN